MRIIISPAKKMTEDDGLPWLDLPAFLPRTEQLAKALQAMRYDELKKLWKCNDQIAALNAERLARMNLRARLTPAILAYEGIQYQYMAPQVFEQDYLDYVQQRLRILSGFYGVLRPLDGVVPYRLEMQARLAVDGFCNLYQFWGDSLAKLVTAGDGTVLNLASEEYAKAVRRHLPANVRWIDCVFGEMDGEKIREKGVYVKMARGEAVRFLAENAIDSPDDLRAFDRLGFRWDKARSEKNRLVFLMDKRKRDADFD